LAGLAPSVPENGSSDDHNYEYLSHLRGMYEIYTSNLNNILNYFLLGSSVLINASIITLDPSFSLSKYYKVGLPSITVFISVVFLLLHFAARAQHDVISKLVETEEVRLVGTTRSFVAASRMPKRLWQRQAVLFPGVYIVVGLSCVGLAIFNACQP
jgi:hypothetical protein